MSDQPGGRRCVLCGGQIINRPSDGELVHVDADEDINDEDYGWVSCGALYPGVATAPASGDYVMSLRVSVELDVRLPRKFDEDELPTISFEIPIEAVGVFIDSQLVPGAQVTGYTTQEDVEVTS